jgi:hypothetical protein
LDVRDGGPSRGAHGDVFELFEVPGIGGAEQGEAGELLGVSERTFRRWQTRYEEDADAGLLDRLLGKASGRISAHVATRSPSTSPSRPIAIIAARRDSPMIRRNQDKATSSTLS